MSTNFSAAPSALGFFFQVRYALLVLLSSLSDNARLYVESLDDIDLRIDATPSELIQLKHNALKKRATLTDASEEFWKSIRIWSERVSSGAVTDPITFSLVTTAIVPDSSVLRAFVPNHSMPIDQLDRRLTEIASTSQNETLQPAFTAFKGLNNVQRTLLISSIRILDASPDIEDVRQQLRAKIPTPARFKDYVLDNLEIRWNNVVIQQLNSEKPLPITKNWLEETIWDIAQQYAEDNLPVDFWEEIEIPGNDETDQMLFVKQLKEIALAKPQISRAIKDYYQAFEQRSRWQRENLLLPNELETYEEKLVDEWTRYLDWQTYSEDDEQSMIDVGRHIFRWIDEAKNFPKIRPKVEEPYVVRGSYQILANAAKPKVWWHPLFLQRLQSLVEVTDPQSRWEQRPIEIANLMNPAFCSLLLRDTIREYQNRNPNGLSYFLMFLILPLVLHKPTRDSLPRTTRSKMQPWIRSNPQALIGFSERVINLKPITTDAISFGMKKEVFARNDDTFLATSRVFRKTKEFKNYLGQLDKSEIADIQAKAVFLGRWFAEVPEVIIAASWGVKP